MAGRDLAARGLSLLSPPITAKVLGAAGRGWTVSKHHPR